MHFNYHFCPGHRRVFEVSLPVVLTAVVLLRVLEWRLRVQSGLFSDETKPDVFLQKHIQRVPATGSHSARRNR